MNERLITNMPSALPGLVASGEKFNFSINTKIQLTEEVDVQLLKYAVEQARMRYPYFYRKYDRVGISQSKTQITLKFVSIEANCRKK